jgi:uncharacterized protein (DUF305 family)
MRLAPALLLSALALPACAPMRGPVADVPQVDVGVAQAQADSLRLPYNEADVTFMTDMIGHHAQAIMISRWVPSHGADSSMRILAARIINAQTDDITLMRNWLRDRGRPVPSVDANGILTPPKADSTDEHAGHDMGAMGHTMAGMLSDEQLAELDAARGEEFEILFLQRMINHHRGAVSMVQTLIRSEGAALDETVFRFAAEVEVDQSTEIRRMLQMLLEKGGIPPA